MHKYIRWSRVSAWIARAILRGNLDRVLQAEFTDAEVFQRFHGEPSDDLVRWTVVQDDTAMVVGHAAQAFHVQGTVVEALS